MIIDIIYGTPTITSENIRGSGLDYKFTVDLAGTDIPAEATYQWYVDNQTKGTTSSIDETFTKENTEHAVKVDVLVNSSIIATKTIYVTTGLIDNPTLSYVKQGDNPLHYVITADTSSTAITDNWTKKWRINDTEVTGDTNTLDYEFALTATAYKAEYIATSQDGKHTRTVSITLTTGNAKEPKINTHTSNELEYNFVADLNLTGINKDMWGLKWTVNPSAVITGDTSTSTFIKFSNYESLYTITLTATPPSGSGDLPVIVNYDFTSEKKPTQYLNTSTITGTYNSTFDTLTYPITLTNGIVIERPNPTTFKGTCPSGYYIPGEIRDVAFTDSVSYSIKDSRIKGGLGTYIRSGSISERVLDGEAWGHNRNWIIEFDCVQNGQLEE